MNLFKKIFATVPGSAEIFTLEHRIVNTTLLVSALICALTAFNAYRYGYAWPYFANLAMGTLVYLFLFLLTRIFRKIRFIPSIYLGLTTCYITAMFFLYQGVEGGITLAFVLINVLFITIMPRRIHVYINLTLIVIFIALFIISENYPSLINAYPNKKLYHRGMLTMVLVDLVFLTLIINSLKKEYEKEQEIVNEQNKALEESQNNLLAAKSETDMILNTINDGLLTINSDFKIGSQFSAKILSIFETTAEALKGRSFSQFICSLNDKLKEESIADYLDILFHKRLNPQKLQMLNPVANLLCQVQDKEKQLTVSFSRVFDENKTVENILVSFVDRTEQAQLESEIEEAKEKAEIEKNMVYSVLKINPSLLSLFLEESLSLIKKINVILAANELSENNDYFDEIFKHMHTLKGNSSLLNLANLANLAHKTEESIKLLRANNFKDSSLKVAFIKTIKDVKEYIESLQASQQNLLAYTAPDNDSNETKYIQESITNFAQRIAEQENKKVKLEVKNLELITQFKDLSALKNIFVQLIRNAIVHGIEDYQRRKTLKKPEIARLQVDFEKIEQALEVTVRDDGGGIDTRKLRQRLLEKEQISQQEANSLSEADIAKKIFSSGISARDAVDINAGQGVGLSATRDEVKKLGGKISFSYKTDEFTKFRLTLPLKAS